MHVQLQFTFGISQMVRKEKKFSSYLRTALTQLLCSKARTSYVRVVCFTHNWLKWKAHINKETNIVARELQIDPEGKSRKIKYYKNLLIKNAENFSHLHILCANWVMWYIQREIFFSHAFNEWQEKISQKN